MNADRSLWAGDFAIREALTRGDYLRETMGCFVGWGTSDPHSIQTVAGRKMGIRTELTARAELCYIEGMLNKALMASVFGCQAFVAERDDIVTCYRPNHLRKSRV